MENYAKIDSIVSNIDKFLSHKGFQVKFNDKFFAVGDICKKAELDWERPLNASPATEYWQALFYSALLQHNATDCNIVVGCPYFMLDRFSAELPKGKHEISLPDGTTRVININKIHCMPECAAHALAFAQQLGTHSLVISVGFGTVELGAATSEGIIDKSLASINYGMHQAAPLFRNELRALGFDNPSIRDDQYFYWDSLLQRVAENDPSLSLNCNDKIWEATDLKPAAEKALNKYSDNLVKQISSYFKKFDTKMQIIATGGGVKHKIVANKLSEFFKSIKYNFVVANEETSLLSAAVGYQYVAKTFYGNKAIGIDIGNHSVITILN